MYETLFMISQNTLIKCLKEYEGHECLKAYITDLKEKLENEQGKNNNICRELEQKEIEITELQRLSNGIEREYLDLVKEYNDNNKQLKRLKQEVKKLKEKVAESKDYKIGDIITSRKVYKHVKDAAYDKKIDLNDLKTYKSDMTSEQSLVKCCKYVLQGLAKEGILKKEMQIGMR